MWVCPEAVRHPIPTLQGFPTRLLLRPWREARSLRSLLGGGVGRAQLHRPPPPSAGFSPSRLRLSEELTLIQGLTKGGEGTLGK